MLFHPSKDLDVTEIAPRVFQGSAPPPGHEVRRAGFNLLVLAAYEYQPKAVVFGIPVIHAPMDDDKLTSSQWLQVVNTARTVAKRVQAGDKTLITCQAGLNRSGIITAVTLHLLTGVAGSRIVRMIQAKREHALCNKSFVERLNQLRAQTLSVGGTR